MKYYFLNTGTKGAMPFPKYALSIGALILAGSLVKTRTGNRIFSELYRVGFGANSSGEVLPPQPEDKKKLPTLVIDIEDLFLIKKWSFSILGYEYEIHPESEVFLFHLANEYEIVSVSSMPNEIADEILPVLDPYGCIKYRMYLPNTQNLKLDKLGRDMKSLLRIRNKETSPNDLSVGKWNGKDSSVDLMSLLDFLLNLNQVNSGDFRGVIKNYRNKPFFETYNRERKTMYPLKRRFILFKNPNAVSDYVGNLNRSRMQEYEIAKEYIENQMKLEKIRKGTM